MSYGFTVKAATKAAVLEAVAAKFDEVIAQQPAHEKDKAAVLANAEAVIGLIVEDPDKDVQVSCNGYLSWMISSNAPISAKVDCAACLVAKA